MNRSIDSLELQHAQGSIEFTHLAVDAGRDHGDLVDEPEVFKMVNALLGLLVGADDGTSLECVEHLGGMKAQYRQIAMSEHAPPFVFHPKGMCRIVDHSEAIVVGDSLNAIHRAGVTVAMHRHDGGGLRSDGGLYFVGVQVEGLRVNVDKDRLDAIPQERVRGGDEGIGCGDDFATDAQGLERRHQCQGAVGEQC